MARAPRKSESILPFGVSAPTRPKRSSIRRSTARDLAAIRAWLEDEDAREIPGNFLCNIGIVERAHQNGELRVYCDGASGQAVAFQLGGLIRPGILAVRHEFRRQGIGRKLVKRCIAQALKCNQPLLYITCEPRTSIPFWRSMGFTIAPSKGSSVGAYRVLQKSIALPANGIPIDVEVSFFPSRKKWEVTTEPHFTLSPMACQTPDGVIHFDCRVAFHEATVEGSDDVVVEIVVNSVRLYLDKAKYEESKDLGFVRCTNGYYIDQIRPADGHLQD